MEQGNKKNEQNVCETNLASATIAKQFPIGMCYVPWQEWKNLYEPHKGWEAGTIFQDLDLRFLGARRAQK